MACGQKSYTYEASIWEGKCKKNYRIQHLKPFWVFVITSRSTLGVQFLLQLDVVGWYNLMSAAVFPGVRQMWKRWCKSSRVKRLKCSLHQFKGLFELLRIHRRELQGLYKEDKITQQHFPICAAHNVRNKYQTNNTLWL